MLGLLNIHTKDTPIIVMALKIILSDFPAACGVFRLLSSDQEDIAIILITNLGYSSIMPDLFLRVVSVDSSMLTVICSPLGSEVTREHEGYPKSKRQSWHIRKSGGLLCLPCLFTLKSLLILRFHEVSRETWVGMFVGEVGLCDVLILP